MADKKSQLGWLFGHGAKTYAKYILWAVVALYLINLIVLLTVALRSFADALVLFGSFWLGALIGLLLGFNVHESEHRRILGAAVWAIAPAFFSCCAISAIRASWLHPTRFRIYHWRAGAAPPEG